IFTLDQYVANGVLSAKHCHVIKNAVREHRNLLVIGGTGSGKTTLINAIIFEMVLDNPDERIVERTAIAEKFFPIFWCIHHNLLIPTGIHL
ncbi:MAG TPA: ATPase, T2SS/T4P/T4SS family, partial [Phnomibacter sp.]|nr:ATPase, T2SS/T4P/T4SS family [Phnomibacter sp.]